MRFDRFLGYSITASPDPRRRESAGPHHAARLRRVERHPRAHPHGSEGHGLIERLEDRIFSTQDVVRGKPAPDLLHPAPWGPTRGAARSSRIAGVEAATAAGMTAFGYAAASPALQKASGGVFQAMAELPRLLGL